MGRGMTVAAHAPSRKTLDGVDLPEASLRGSSVTIGTMRRRLAWPPRKDDTRTSRNVTSLTAQTSPRPKKTRAIRRALKTEQKCMKTPKQKSKARPTRRVANGTGQGSY